MRMPVFASRLAISEHAVPVSQHRTHGGWLAGGSPRRPSSLRRRFPFFSNANDLSDHGSWIVIFCQRVFDERVLFHRAETKTASAACRRWRPTIKVRGGSFSMRGHG